MKERIKPRRLKKAKTIILRPPLGLYNLEFVLFNFTLFKAIL